MRIGIDARLWDQTGVGRYIRNLVRELYAIDKKNKYILFVTPELFASSDFEFARTEESAWKVVPTDIRWHTVEEQLLFSKVLDNEALDLVHFPYFSIPILYTKSYVITIHDLIINHFPTGKASTLPSPVYHFKRLAYKYVLRHAAKTAKKIITVSEATKKEIIDHLPVTEDKIKVTYEGIDLALQRKGERGKREEKSTLPFPLNAYPYFLYVGNAYPHKNCERLVEAFALVNKASPATKLIMVGKKNYFYQRLEEKVGKIGLQKKIIFTGAVDDQELAALYQNAQALLFPSLMEGFGLPGLEAMQNKCLVLASDIPVFKEVYQDAAVYFDPLDIQQMSDTMQKVLENKSKYKAYIQKGLERTKKFSWQKMAEETVAIYESSTSVRSGK
ncbi:MAG: glycosyltransferase family 4 protein [Candidatus Levybacteria bacterium]|nr:glycosyltransferase family 4 protein [Candidatus Levybacteria bacterium]